VALVDLDGEGRWRGHAHYVSLAFVAMSNELTDADRMLLDAAIDGLLAVADPRTTDPVTFRGLRYDHGLAWLSFDKGFGGLNLAPQAQAIVERRLRAAGAPPTDPALFFLNLAGPTIHTHGTDEQKRRLLRPMFSGEHRWCQLFSEPGAGSDFAGLGTRAVRDGDEWVVNGQKVWNTLAHMADWGMLVTRTDPEQPKHKGMTYFALDMHSPGVDVRPLRQITGEAEFNEVYLTDVRVPDANRIGAVGEGWRVSLTTLMNERVSIGSGSGSTPKRGAGAIGQVVELWNGLTTQQRSGARRERLMQLWSRAETLRLTNIRAGQARRAGNPGPEGSISKLALAELNKSVYELGVELLGAHGMVDFDYTFRRSDTLNDDTWGDPRHAFLRVRANSIEGGTSEILRNILGEQVLGLPGEPRVDKDLAWSKVPRNLRTRRRRSDPFQLRPVEQRRHAVHQHVRIHRLVRGNRTVACRCLQDDPQQGGVAGGVEEQLLAAEDIVHGALDRVRVAQRLVPGVVRLCRVLRPAPPGH
jgi:alkylation response protein AidB-like acyl-CoA dehydrogenase